jgi:hypothetical protein
LRRKAHTAPTAPLVLDCTGIGKCAVKNSESIDNCGINFFIFIFHFLLVKAAVNALHLCKLHKDCHTGIGHSAMVFTKRLHFFIFRLPKAEQGLFAHLRIVEGLSFISLDSRIYYCKLRNEKKDLILLCSDFSPPISKLVA